MNRIERHCPPKAFTALEEPTSSSKRLDMVDRLQPELLESNARNERTPQSQRLQPELIANLARELHSPLNAIIGFAQLLREEQAGPLEARQIEFIDNIESSGRTLFTLLNDILDLARIKAGMIDFRPALVDLDDVLRSAIRALHSIAGAKRLRIESTVDPALRENVAVDAGRLRQALRSFLLTTIKFTPEGGKIAVRALVETETSFRLEVEDLGAGIERTILRDLFEGRRPEARHGEVELGLALTRALIEAQGGRIEICSSMGEGSILVAVLPRRPAIPPGH